MNTVQFVAWSSAMAVGICVGSTLAYAWALHAIHPSCASVLACVRL